jgi:hypothetical protein
LYKNKIQFNCINYHRMSVLIPMNCYNCLLRDGYPENLGGDENCLSYKAHDSLTNKICICKEPYSLFNDMGLVRCQNCMGLADKKRGDEWVKYNTPK